MKKDILTLILKKGYLNFKNKEVTSMEKNIVAKILAEAYHKEQDLKWENMSGKEQQRWLDSVDVLEREVEKLPV